MKIFQKEPFQSPEEAAIYQKAFGNYNILEEIARAKEEIEVAYLHFQNVIDPDLIDCYIFESNAAWKRYRFLLKQAKLLETTKAAN